MITIGIIGFITEFIFIIYLFSIINVDPLLCTFDHKLTRINLELYSLRLKMSVILTPEK
jgi:hypothetical protein